MRKVFGMDPIAYEVQFHIVVDGDRGTLSAFHDDISWTDQFYPHGPDSGILKFLDTQEMSYDMNIGDKNIVIDRLNELVQKYSPEFFVNIEGTIINITDPNNSTSIRYRDGIVEEVA